MQDQLRSKLAEIAGTSPGVTAFSIERTPVGPILADASQSEEFEQLDPNVLASITETVALKLTRATRPMAFDVALLTRNVVEEQGFEMPIEYGTNEANVDMDDEASDGGEQGEE